MKIERPLWTRGILVSPQQFQQQASLEAWTNECIAQMGVLHPWGVLHASFEQDALAQGRLKAERLHLRFQDGTLVDTDSADLLPVTLTLAANLPAQANEATVLLAVPQTYANGGNCLQPDEIAERPVRYRQAWRDVQNQFGDDKKQIAVMTHELSLRLSSQENGNYQTCPVALLRRDQQGRWTQDKSFIPPLLSLQASHWCSEQLEILMVQLRARLQRLMGMRRESNARMADFAVADVSLFWLLNALNSAEPVLGNFQRYPQVHPERLYQELARLAGSLLTFSLEHDSTAIPVYQHDDLTAVFPPLFALLNILLEASLPSRLVAVELVHEPRFNQWRADLHDPRLREDVDFYLSVRSTLSSAQLQTQFPQLCKVGAPDDVGNVVNVALSGIPLRALTHVPAAIPLRLENQYFSLNLNHPAAKQMMEAGACVFYVPGTLGEIQLELFAVLRA
ncbi:MAG: type VI secretion system baseplate subunit TssK [Ewingella americana]|jgi:type VI secretion system protein ImpJ|uniref:type VI secretion system baseplate subunit TssK n=1 Tax=Ewingella americana TaxID=41202 RepID=UPI00242A9034|nr:type VI secretion system baseplate subunit TssK [Ewingella americana]MCI1679239.1 type VI secretion system baseplate subunit TssK [Ewingella americana]MCI1852117.1 type VI secretion system baseplate subunit TssK [Ewingella americana]MCI1862519.1 type VI secretion system baseplate subunit TssK [Ewingella americana]MCI2142699.1 type VI secretion system baseplate subunit TssK [Ewingella americana]MCI2165346.1 type VI secretion system baseplate subunit TssK [Ewingella americana]